MTAEIHQRAKLVFNELLEADDAVRAARLSKLREESPEVEQEVRSLLEYHTSQSLVVPRAASRRIKTRSTLSTTYHRTSILSWLNLGILPGLIATALSLIAVLLLTPWTVNRLRNSIAATLSTRLSETADLCLSEFEQWETQQIAVASGWCQNPTILEAVKDILAAADGLPPGSKELSSKLLANDGVQRLSKSFADLVGMPIKFALWDRRMVTVADWNQDVQRDALGAFVTPAGAALLTPILKGNAKMILPDWDKPVTEGYELETSEPIISIFVPIRGEEGEVIAAMLVRGFGLEQQYAELLKSWRDRCQGEIYLINQSGAMVTESRYRTELNDLDLARDTIGTEKVVLVRDPGVNLLLGQKPEYHSAAWPPTALARQVTSGNNGLSIEGYRNYVGETVVGAWRWLPQHNLGIAVEERYDDAYQLAQIVKSDFFKLSAIFSLALLSVAAITTINNAGRKRLKYVSEVGPYQIQELLGEGGMGRVYLAEHALLCRQSAIKLLTKGHADLNTISRFEREVQLASQLTHPNTISIYDFGRNKDGTFYYAMEYIDGAHLGQLVEYEGPIQPGRCIYILQQLCRALQEAHEAGVVHRDIKPQNIMVCDRGGEPDFVKLFDYGLVKAFAPGISQNTSQTRIVVGTPRFMAPERLNSPWLADPRVDVYSVGALAYYLLTGKLPPLVTYGNQGDNDQPGIETLDLPPGVVEFGGLLSICMSVEPAARPSSMASLLHELDELAKTFTWSRHDSTEWWEKHETKLLRLVHLQRKKLANSSASADGQPS